MKLNGKKDKKRERSEDDQKRGNSNGPWRGGGNPSLIYRTQPQTESSDGELMISFFNQSMIIIFIEISGKKLTRITINNIQSQTTNNPQKQEN